MIEMCVCALSKSREIETPESFLSSRPAWQTPTRRANSAIGVPSGPSLASQTQIDIEVEL